MKVAVFVKATRQSEAGEMPGEQLLTDMTAYNEQLVKAGIMLGGEGLHPSSKGARVRFTGTERTVVDGPFTETKELVAGYWIWQVQSLEEAIEWVKRCPNPMTEPSEIEIRPIFEAVDFGEAFTPELQEREEKLRQALGDGNSPAPERFETGRAMLVAGVNASYTPETCGNIPTQWAGFVPQLGHVKHQTGKACYGVCWNPHPGGGFDYLCGVEVSSADGLPTGFTEVTIPAQRYAVFSHRGHVSALGETCDAIWNKWLPKSGVKPAKSPWFERYSEEFNPTTGLGGMEIWIPIQP